MFSKFIVTLSLIIFSNHLYSQDIEKLSGKYENNKRDLEIVKEYHSALISAKNTSKAKEVAEEFFYATPVLQMEDRDTYLFINDMLYKDVYSNAFEYAIYAYRKLNWEREATGNSNKLSQKDIMFLKMSSIRSGVSKTDDIDKRYEAMSAIMRNLSREVREMCSPKYVDGTYAMPKYNKKKIDKLDLLSKKAAGENFIGADALIIRVSNTKAYYNGDFKQIIDNSVTLANLGIGDISVGYFSDMIGCVVRHIKDKEYLKRLLDDTLRIITVDGEIDVNSYRVLSILYKLNGDMVKSDYYINEWTRIENERNETFKHLINKTKK